MKILTRSGMTYSEHVSSHLLEAFGLAFDPSLRPKRVTVIAKDILISVENPGIHADCRTGRNELVMKDQSPCWHVALEHEPCAGVDSKCLHDDRIASVIHKRQLAFNMGRHADL